MTENSSEHHTPTNDRHPFDKFQKTVRNLLQVPKQELDEARRKPEVVNRREDGDTSDKG